MWQCNDELKQEELKLKLIEDSMSKEYSRKGELQIKKKHFEGLEFIG